MGTQGGGNEGRSASSMSSGSDAGSDAGSSSGRRSTDGDGDSVPRRHVLRANPPPPTENPGVDDGIGDRRYALVQLDYQTVPKWNLFRKDVRKSRIRTPLPFFKMVPHNLDLRCVFRPAPLTAGAGCQTRLESRFDSKKVYPQFMCA